MCRRRSGLRMVLRPSPPPDTRLNSSWASAQRLAKSATFTSSPKVFALSNPAASLPISCSNCLAYWALYHLAINRLTTSGVSSMKPGPGRKRCCSFELIGSQAAGLLSPKGSLAPQPRSTNTNSGSMMSPSLGNGLSRCQTTFSVPREGCWPGMGLNSSPPPPSLKSIPSSRQRVRISPFSRCSGA